MDEGLAGCVDEVRGAHTEIENELANVNTEWRANQTSYDSILQFSQKLPFVREQLQVLVDSLQTKILVLALSASYSDLIRLGMTGDCLSLVKQQQDNECLQVVLNAYDFRIKQLILLEFIISFTLALHSNTELSNETLGAVVFLTLKGDFALLADEDGIDWISISRVLAKYQYMLHTFSNLCVPDNIFYILAPISSWIFNSPLTRAGSISEDQIGEKYAGILHSFRELSKQYDWKHVGIDHDDPTTWHLLLQYYLQQGFRDIFLHSMAPYRLYPIVECDQGVVAK